METQQLGKFEQEGNTDSEQKSSTESPSVRNQAQAAQQSTPDPEEKAPRSQAQSTQQTKEQSTQQSTRQTDQRAEHSAEHSAKIPKSRALSRALSKQTKEKQTAPRSNGGTASPPEQPLSFASSYQLRNCAAAMAPVAAAHSLAPRCLPLPLPPAPRPQAPPAPPRLPTRPRPPLPPPQHRTRPATAQAPLEPR